MVCNHWWTVFIYPFEQRQVSSSLRASRNNFYIHRVVGSTFLNDPIHKEGKLLNVHHIVDFILFFEKLRPDGGLNRRTDSTNWTKIIPTELPPPLHQLNLNHYFFRNIDQIVIFGPYQYSIGNINMELLWNNFSSDPAL
jgi:hypothetical protein